MSMAGQVRFLPFGILPGCGLVETVFNSLITAAFIDLITFIPVAIVLLIELARVRRGLYRENDASAARLTKRMNRHGAEAESFMKVVYRQALH